MNIAAQRSINTDIGIEQAKVVQAINELRAEGCFCSSRYFKSVGPIRWNDVLVESAYIQAKMMKRHKLFAHVGPDGRDVADKMEMVGYNWHFAGENLGEGQKHFFEVLQDWKDSRTHCELLMNPNMEHIGLIRYGKYWVLHMGKELPKNKRRINERYTEN